MWLFSVKGFVSIVADKSHPGGLLLVRGRFAGDIENLFPDAKVKKTPHHDYRFRARLPRAEVADRLAGLVSEIDYSNFKDQIHDHAHHDAYFNVWRAMWDAQNHGALKNSL
jgi:hypothetical protein